MASGDADSEGEGEGEVQATYRAERAYRDASGYSVAPLGLMALAFFMPAVRDCNAVVSPLQEARSSGALAAFIVPTFVTAAVLALATVWLFWRKEPPRRGYAVAGTLLVWACAFGYLPAVATAGAVVLPVYIVVATLLAGLTVWAMRARRWVRWGRVIACYTLAQVLAPIAWIMAISAVADRRESGPGAYVYSLGLAVLVVVWGYCVVAWKWLNRVAGAPRVEPRVYR